MHEADRTFEPKAERPTPGSADVCLITLRPIEDILAHLGDCGVDVELGPVGRAGAEGAMTSIYFRDPDRNLVEVAGYDG